MRQVERDIRSFRCDWNPRDDDFDVPLQISAQAFLYLASTYNRLTAK